MKQIAQQPHGSSECLRYAVASLFELEPETVPHFIQDGVKWGQALAGWARKQGYEPYFAAYLYATPSWRTVRLELPAGGYIGIIAPNTKRRCHAVVMDGTRVFYDPSRYPRQRYQKRGMGVIEFLHVANI